jgi:hypothetical protein
MSLMLESAYFVKLHYYPELNVPDQSSKLPHYFHNVLLLKTKLCMIFKLIFGIAFNHYFIIRSPSPICFYYQR